MNILLVEDSPMMQERLRSMIAEISGANLIAEVDNQLDAINMIERARPDVVILDLQLAGGNGMEVLRQIKPSLPATRVIVLTNNSYPQYRKKCLELGAECFLDKSRDIAILGKLLVCAVTSAARTPFQQ